ncbi:hypothetical protein BH10PSE1_BH10PSE1_28650 [soil metagenome]
MRRLFAAALAATAVLGGCSSLPAALPFVQDRADVVTASMPGELEPIHAAALVNNVAVFWVSSNGCTSKDDLQPFVQTHGDASVITLRRISEDRCKTPLDEGFEVQWSYQELGLKPGASVSVNNPYQLPAAPLT